MYNFKLNNNYPATFSSHPQSIARSSFQLNSIWSFWFPTAIWWTTWFHL